MLNQKTDDTTCHICSGFFNVDAYSANHLQLLSMNESITVSVYI